MSERSIHDNYVYAYAVLCEQRQIILHTEYRDGQRQEYTDVIFNGVIVHYFECVLPNNILFGIDEVEVERIVLGRADLFAMQKNYGWPPIKYKDPEELILILQKEQIKGFEISSSFGLSGWVLAKGMDLQVRSARYAS